ncbi:hypothetical protein [Streptomyces longwoodensis]|uniref:hypothetical protein n=1 Tax=Streptomyces longwoodensis TaxID=68231 RepID=UPI0022523B79|nr:hypothetical protein [Streptomyces longwoodensis]MCX4995516.1 hypothetical protein [Streptomyces longwoodensis]
MADEYRWLDGEAAERLLRGESPDDAVPSAAREQAERLSRTLDALSASLTGSAAAEPASASAPAPASALGDRCGELPGEAAALAAFRAAREEPAGTGSGLVRIGRPGQRGTARSSRRHTVRLGLAAALIAGTVGGVAVAAGTGVLPEPFGGTGPEPATSVSATPGPGDHPDPTPSPRAGDSATVDGSEGGTTTGPAEPGSAHGTPPEVAAACHAVRQGRTLNPVLRHTLENRAGGPSRITAYCTDLLEEQKGGSGKGKNHGNGNGNSGNSGNNGNGNAGGNKADSGGTGQGNNGNGNGNGNGSGGNNANSGGTGQGNDGTPRGQGQGQGQGHDHGGQGQGRNAAPDAAPTPGSHSTHAP